MAVRCQFITGLLAYVCAQALRVRFSLRRFNDLACCAMCCLMSAASGMLAYNNAHTVTFGGYVGLLQRWVVLSVRFFYERVSSRQPMAYITAATAASALFFLIRASASAGRIIVSDLMLGDGAGEAEDD